MGNPAKLLKSRGPYIEIYRNFPIGTLPALSVESPIKGSKKGVFRMTFSFLETRQLATSLAAALITSLLFVSAATSLPIA